jgi:hypothetical protein
MDSKPVLPRFGPAERDAGCDCSTTGVQVFAAGNACSGAPEAGGVCCSKELLRVGSLSVPTQTRRGGELEVQLSIIAPDRAVPAGSGGNYCCVQYVHVCLLEDQVWYAEVTGRSMQHPAKTSSHLPSSMPRKKLEVPEIPI